MELKYSFTNNLKSTRCNFLCTDFASKEEIVFLSLLRVKRLNYSPATTFLNGNLAHSIGIVG